MWHCELVFVSYLSRQPARIRGAGVERALLLHSLTAPCSSEKITQTAACRVRLSFFLFLLYFYFCRAPSYRGQPFAAIAVAGSGERFRAGTYEHCCGTSFCLPCGVP
jgi:hypothetical protein